MEQIGCRLLQHIQKPNFVLFAYLPACLSVYLTLSVWSFDEMKCSRNKTSNWPVCLSASLLACFCACSYLCVCFWLSWKHVNKMCFPFLNECLLFKHKQTPRNNVKKSTFQRLVLGASLSAKSLGLLLANEGKAHAFQDSLWKEPFFYIMLWQRQVSTSMPVKH